MMRIPAMTAKPRQRGFTLAELMVSIAIALILILGVSMIFTATSKTTGAGEALSRSTQLSRAVKTAISDDLKNLASDSGVFVIRMQQLFAFESNTDRQGAQDPSKPWVDPLFPGGTVPTTSVNSRSHRVDRLGFFVRGSMDRQTALVGGNIPPGTPTLIRPTQSTEAWIWYGHLAQPNNVLLTTANAASGGYYQPADPNPGNDNNYFATDWTLGRMQLLLGNGTDPQSLVRLRNQNPDFIAFQPWTSSEPSLAFSPLTWGALSSINNEPAESSLHDVAQTTIADYTARLQAWVLGGGQSSFDPSGSEYTWWDALMGYYTINGTEHRYHGSPYLPGMANQNRFTGTSLSVTAPCITRGCVHFIVEYAGNYLNQDEDLNSPYYGQLKRNPSGTIIGGPSPDPNHIDWMFVPDATGTVHQVIRWYGLPRITNSRALSPPPAQPTINDVLPLRDVQVYYGIPPTQAQAPFEHFSDRNSAEPGFPAAASLGNVPDYGAMPAGAWYTCAWGPYPAGNYLPPGIDPASYQPPKLLRITIAIDDPNGRLNDAQFFEYVIDLRQ